MSQPCGSRAVRVVLVVVNGDGDGDDGGAVLGFRGDAVGEVMPSSLALRSGVSGSQRAYVAVAVAVADAVVAVAGTMHLL